jgi:hypothetical protein
VFEQFGVYTMQGYVNGVQKQQTATSSALKSAVSVPSVATSAVGMLQSAAASAFPSTVTLLDKDGSILTRAQVLIDQNNDARSRAVRAGA